MNRIKSFIYPLTSKRAFLILFLLGFTVYFNSLFNGFVSDDFAQVVYNPAIRSFSNIPKLLTNEAPVASYYRPIMFISYDLIYSVFGTNPFWYHFFQVLLHIVSATVLFLVLKYFFKKETSLVLSIIFLIHPINTDSVSAIAHIQESLFVFFGLSAIYLLIKKEKNFKIFSLLFLSILSKETGIIFFFIILLFQFLYQKSGVTKNIVKILGLFLFYLFFRTTIAKTGFENGFVSAPIQSLSLIERLINVPKIIFYYLHTFFYPVDLIVYQTWIVKSIDFTNFYFPLFIDLAFFVLIFAFGIYLRKNKDLFKKFIFFFSWFLVGLLFHLQIFPLEETVSNNWFYFPIIGLLGLIGILYEDLVKDSRYKNHVFILLSVVLVLFSVRVINRNLDWKSNESLYNHDIKFNSQSYQLRTGLAAIAYVKGDKKTAEKYYLEAINIYPSYATYFVLGGFYLTTNQYEKAAVVYKKALTYNSSISVIFINLGITEYNAGEKKSGIENVKKAYSINQSLSTLRILNTMNNNLPITYRERYY